ncbi:GbsR/MarR family transcriptional regulator [Streptomyces sp. NPDC059740]|uniref:GbsR/MarR family transcriptional regulator n=1 Tax=Streptomyces sp. NPDC059740 TaxID=3346926 RepID=UPI00364B2067
MAEERQEQAGAKTDPVPSASDASRFVERFAAQLTDAGMQRMPARVFAALLASETGVLTSAELGERLQISPAAVSGAVRYLAQVGMISRERDPGSRRDHYRIDDWHDALAQRDNALLRWQGVLREGVEVFGAESAAGRRIGETLEFITFMQDEMVKMLARWREHRRQLRDGEA